jgi:hypothetical protein
MSLVYLRDTSLSRDARGNLEAIVAWYASLAWVVFAVIVLAVVAGLALAVLGALADTARDLRDELAQRRRARAHDRAGRLLS